jgi:hypothetical protein
MDLAQNGSGISSEFSMTGRAVSRCRSVSWPGRRCCSPTEHQSRSRKYLSPSLHRLFTPHTIHIRPPQTPSLHCITSPSPLLEIRHLPSLVISMMKESLMPYPCCFPRRHRKMLFRPLEKHLSR